MKRTLLLAVLALAALAHGDGDVRFTSIKELSKIPSQHIPSGTRFSVTGQVISVFHRYNVRTLFITDATNLIVVGDWTKKPSGRHGDIVAISGSAETDARNGLSGLAALAIDVIDNAPLPDTPPLDWNTYLLPHDDNSCFMSVSGVVFSSSKVLRRAFSSGTRPLTRSMYMRASNLSPSRWGRARPST